MTQTTHAEEDPEAAADNDVPSPAPHLTGRQKRQLRGLAHELNPIVNVGHKGVTDGVIGSLDQALTDHELVKVKVNQNNLDSERAVADALGDGTGAAVVQRIGRTIVLYRPHPEDPQIELETR